MKSRNKFSQHYGELLEGEYDCIDRLVLNGYYPKLLSGGGLRDWWRQLHGNDTDLSTASLMRMAGVMSKRVQAYCKQKKYHLSIIRQVNVNMRMQQNYILKMLLLKAY